MKVTTTLLMTLAVLAPAGTFAQSVQRCPASAKLTQYVGLVCSNGANFQFISAATTPAGGAPATPLNQITVTTDGIGDGLFLLTPPYNNTGGSSNWEAAAGQIQTVTVQFQTDEGTGSSFVYPQSYFYGSVNGQGNVLIQGTAVYNANTPWAPGAIFFEAAESCIGSLFGTCPFFYNGTIAGAPVPVTISITCEINGGGAMGSYAGVGGLYLGVASTPDAARNKAKALRAQLGQPPANNKNNW